MKISDTERAMVSQQCQSTESKSVLTGLLTGGTGKGQKVNNPLLIGYARQRKFRFRRFWLDRQKQSLLLTWISRWSTVMVRNRLNYGIAVLMDCSIDAWSP